MCKSHTLPPTDLPISDPHCVVTGVEKLPLEKRPMAIHSVVEAIGSPDITYPKLQRAVKAGLIPSSTLQNSRKLIRICDVFKAMGIQDDGGSNE